MIKLLSTAALSCSLTVIPAFSGQTVFIDQDFESPGFSVPNTLEWPWESIKGDTSNWEIRDQDPDGTSNKSVWINGGNIRTQTTDEGSFLPLQITPSNAEPVVFRVDIYDFLDGLGEGVQSYAELRVVHGASWQATIFAAGVFGDGGTHYRARAYPDLNWVTLSVERTEGWHTFYLVIRRDTFDVYVNQSPYDAGSAPDPNATNLSWSPHGSLGSDTLRFDEVHIGGAASTAHEFLYDNVFVANDPALAPAVEISEQPTAAHPGPGAVGEFGGSVVFSVTADGPATPLTYQWLKDGEPIEDGVNITGANTAEVTLSNLDGSESGMYGVRITDANNNSVLSSAVRLWAMIEHEVIMNAVDLPEEAFTGSWSTLSTTGGWFGWMAANQTNDPDAEALATFQPTITQSGWYDVYSWYVPSFAGASGNRGSEVPYDVHHASGMDTVIMNQQNPAGPTAQQWFHVGTFEFAEGSEGKVEISNLRRGPSGEEAFGNLALADAVRFIPTDAPPVDMELPGIAIARGEGETILIELIGGLPNTTYQIDSSGDLVNWDTVGTVETDGGGNATFTDETGALNDRRFYRVSAP